MMNKSVFTSDEEKATFNSVTSKPYKEQAKFFLNAFWPEIGGMPGYYFTPLHSLIIDELENIWKNYHVFIDLDVKHEEGSQLDEVLSHRFLEILGEPMTALQLRARLREIDINKDGYMALIEYMLHRHQGIQSVTVGSLLNRPQTFTGDDELGQAERALNEVNMEIMAIEKQKKKLEDAASKGGVKGNAAKNELAQLLTQDPINLRRALVTAEARLKKARKESGGSACMGTLWWMERELLEAKKYKPKSKQ